MKTVSCDGAQLCWALWEVEREVAKVPRRVFSEDDSAFDGSEPLLVDRPQRAQVPSFALTSFPRWGWPADQ